MKGLLGLTVAGIIMTGAAWAGDCPDLTGAYKAQMSDPQIGDYTIEYTISQTGCEAVRFDIVVELQGQKFQARQDLATDGVCRTEKETDTECWLTRWATAEEGEALVFEQKSVASSELKSRTLVAKDDQGKLVQTEIVYEGGAEAARQSWTFDPVAR